MTNYSNILVFNQLLSNWKFVPRFLANLFSICRFLKNTLYLCLIGVYVHFIWLCLTIIRLRGDIKENVGPKRNSNQSFSIFTGILKVLLHTTTLNIPFQRLYFTPQFRCCFLYTTAIDINNLKIAGYKLLRSDHAYVLCACSLRDVVFLYTANVHLL